MFSLLKNYFPPLNGRRRKNGFGDDGLGTLVLILSIIVQSKSAFSFVTSSIKPFNSMKLLPSKWNLRRGIGGVVSVVQPKVRKKISSLNQQEQQLSWMERDGSMIWNKLLVLLEEEYDTSDLSSSSYINFFDNDSNGNSPNYYSEVNDDYADSSITTTDRGITNVQEMWYGLSLWNEILKKGRLPVENDFLLIKDDETNTSQARRRLWPRKPLFSFVVQYMAQLQLPQFVQRHPETINSILLSIIRIQMKFKDTLNNQQKDDHDLPTEDEEEEFDEDILRLKQELQEQQQKQYSWSDGNNNEGKNESNEENETDIAEQIVAATLIEEYGAVVEGMQTIDVLLGGTRNNMSDLGYGLQDGIWKHTGWKPLSTLLQQISEIPDLQTLIRGLGKRPTASNQMNNFHKFHPYEQNDDGTLAATINDLDTSSINGVTLSNRLSDMLPSEAAMLIKSPLTKRLFMSKLIESKLTSYATSGWHDIPSSPKTKRSTIRPRLPTSPGGPIVICLDTSWSMTGPPREDLAKAVVIASVMSAHKQCRDCYVVAFSSASNVMAVQQLSGFDHISQILDFCSHSFVGGGTDVTGALMHAMEILHKTKNEKQDDTVDDILSSRLSSADLLLVTDGEIPNPPVSDGMMKELNILQQKTGMKIHGLLVGDKETSEPLEQLCSEKPHDFLVKYEKQHFLSKININHERNHGRVDNYSTNKHSRYYSSALSYSGGLKYDPNTPFFCTHRKITTRTSRLSSFWQYMGFSSKLHRNERSHKSFHLYARKFRKDKYDDFNDDTFDDDLELSGRKYQKTKGRKKRNENKNKSYDEETWTLESESYNVASDESSLLLSTSNEYELGTEKSFREQVDAELDLVLSKIEKIVLEQKWDASQLDLEKERDGSCWPSRGELETAVDIVGKNLIERGEESRLVVLGLISREHVLLVGPPGTGKSILGRRLSQLCGIDNEQFFQRLLTKFTTPEEIFGPLSLRALENDEYKRCTEGFLPTASVAFLDEIFKANSAILNTLLTILNERQFDNGAGTREYCPIRCVVGASNELPDSEELDAIYDRFLLRKEVLPVSEEGLMELLSMGTPGDDSPCDEQNSMSETCDFVMTDGLDKLAEDLSHSANQVRMSPDACFLLRDLRKFMKDELDVNVSDRRLVKASRLLKLSAASHGRTQVDQLDCLLLQHIAWRFPEQRMAVRDWLWNHLTPGVQDDSSPRTTVSQFRFVLNGLRKEAIETVKRTSGDITGKSGARPSDLALIQSISSEVANLASVLQTRSDSLSRHLEILSRSSDHLWLGTDEGLAAQQILVPKAESFQTEIDKILFDALTLNAVLRSEDSYSITNNLRLAMLEILWEDDEDGIMNFTDKELSMDKREAKNNFDFQTFQKWKRTRKALNKS